MRRIDWIVLHCTAGPQNQTPQAIQDYWRRPKNRGGLGWNNPGYHRIILAQGQVHQYAPYSAVTNGVAGHNRHAIHISYTGGVGRRGEILDNRTPEQRASMEKEVLEAHELFPNATICGHRDFSPDRNRNGIIEPHEWIKSCPSFSVTEWLKEIGFKRSTPREVRMTLAFLNIRQGPGTGFSPVRPPLSPMTEVQVLSRSNGWAYVQVQQDGSLGWVSEQFLSIPV